MDKIAARCFNRCLINGRADRATTANFAQLFTGSRMIAEFVEKVRNVGALQQIGADFAQGYGIAKPRPLDELIQAACPCEKAA